MRYTNVEMIVSPSKWLKLPYVCGGGDGSVEYEGVCAGGGRVVFVREGSDSLRCELRGDTGRLVAPQGFRIMRPQDVALGVRPRV